MFLFAKIRFTWIFSGKYKAKNIYVKNRGSFKYSKEREVFKTQEKFVGPKPEI